MFTAPAMCPSANSSGVRTSMICTPGEAITEANSATPTLPGPAGWAWYVDDDRWAAGGWPHGTNNMGELMAVLDLLRATRGAWDDLLVYCDSQYVINAVTRWMPGWKRKGWKKAYVSLKPGQEINFAEAI